MTTPANTILFETRVHCSTDGTDVVNVDVGHLLSSRLDRGTVMLMPAGCGGIEMAPAIARALACELTLAAERAEAVTDG